MMGSFVVEALMRRVRCVDSVVHSVADGERERGGEDDPLLLNFPY